MNKQKRFLLTKEYELINTVGAFVFEIKDNCYVWDGRKILKDDVIFECDTKKELIDFLIENDIEIKSGEDWLR